MKKFRQRTIIISKKVNKIKCTNCIPLTAIETMILSSFVHLLYKYKMLLAYKKVKYKYFPENIYIVNLFYFIFLTAQHNFIFVIENTQPFKSLVSLSFVECFRKKYLMITKTAFICSL